MADENLTINNADGSSKTYTINRDKFAGVRSMQVNGQTVTVDRTAVPKEQDRETTFGGTQSITVKRDIDPLLNKVVGGAAAAYSLRDLNDKQGNNKVARVRRIDNAEKDFLGNNIDKVADWVNGKQDTTLPCDVASAAAAYSLRPVNSNYTGNILRVRRSSNNAEKDFSDVSLIADWVNEGYVSNLTNTWSLGSSNNDFLSNASSANQITATANSSAGSAGARLLYTFDNFVAEVGSTITATFNVTSITGEISIKYMLSPFPSTTSGGNELSINSTGTFTYSQTITNKAYGIVAIFGANDAIDAKLTSLTVSGEVVNGYVTTWYDQSGNGNNATQSTASSQPKIVDAGVLVSDGIDFDGVDDEFETSAFISGSTSSFFSLLNCNDISATEQQAWNFTDEGSHYHGLTFNRSAAGNVGFAATNPSVDLGESGYSGASKLFSTFSATQSKYFSNGIESSSTVLGRHSPTVGNTIGSQGSSGRYLNGNISEIIVYNSDQSANRFKIESNINNHYGLYTNANDGFVTSWYDQSGNSNDATQSVAASQPKIVDAGVYLGELDFDGVDDQLDYPLAISNLNNASSFVIASFQNTADNQFVLTMSGGGNNRWYAPIIWNGSYRFGYGFTVDSINIGTPDTNKHLFTATAGATTFEGFFDGVSKGSQVSVSNTVGDQSFIGAHTTSKAYPLDGSISEIIIYDSDQSANRAAIETNINNYYDIY